MCGILGGTWPALVNDNLLVKMTDSLARRGPDSQGQWRGEDVFLGHRRLSILDLSSAGSQPMVDEDSGIALVYNGECYNHLELRKKLPHIRWKSSSDTETILELYKSEGIRFVRRLVGMFALAIYDPRKKRLFLARDRMGEKPLYYRFHDGLLFFASDLRPFFLHPKISKEIDRRGLSEFLLHNYIPDSLSILKGVQKLRPGHILDYDFKVNAVYTHRYWSLGNCLEKGPLELSSSEAVDEAELLLRRSVAGQTLTDVPLGCFLSGGVDSSLIAALLQQQTGKARTFTIAFDEKEFDESDHARAVADHLGTQHTTLTARPEDCLQLFEQLPDAYSEPFADASMLPTMLLSRLTREHVTVALSGDGGDELFLGYDRYHWLEKIKMARHVPAPLRVALMRVAARLPNYKLQMLTKALSFPSQRVMYSYLFTHWNREFVESVYTDAKISHRRLAPLPRKAYQRSLMERAAMEDLAHYLPDDILVKVDRAAMYSSLETRAPFLDHRLVEFALRLPEPLKLMGGKKKGLLKEMLGRHVPERLYNRPKRGFAVPLRHWFRGPLRPLLDRVLDPERLRSSGLFHVPSIRELRQRHDSGKYNHERQLLALVVFELWRERYLP